VNSFSGAIDPAEIRILSIIPGKYKAIGKTDLGRQSEHVVELIDRDTAPLLITQQCFVSYKYYCHIVM
jgi:hypothetical protein